MPTLPAWPTTLEDIHNILNRAVTFDNAYLSPCMDDDIAMLQQLKPHFLGRAAHIWHTHKNDLERFEQVRHFCNRVHDEVDPGIFIQCAIFECITPEANDIAIPAWVFETLNEEVETRNFRFGDIIADFGMREQQRVVWGETGGIPDLRRPEAIRWFLYRAGMYMEAGIEAIHVGQIHLVGCMDQYYLQSQRLCQLFRQLATTKARRGRVLMDAHTHGVVVDGESLFDFVSRPISAKSYVDQQGVRRLALQWKDGMCTGNHPMGLGKVELPVLVEIDNYGGLQIPPSEMPADVDITDQYIQLPEALCLAHGRWGFDDIGFFARLNDQDRKDFLTYAHHFHRLAKDNIFLQPAITRLLATAPVNMNGTITHYYRANNPTATCPDGWGDIDHIAKLWSQPDPREQHPENLITEFPKDPHTVHVPEPIVLIGDLQVPLGGIPGESRCVYSRLDPLAPMFYARTIVIERPGQYRFIILSGGTGNEPITSAKDPAGEPFEIVTTKPAQRVIITFHYPSRTVVTKLL